MRSSRFSPKFIVLSQIIMAIFMLFSLTSAYAGRGCCAWHKGESEQCTSDGKFMLCKDGSPSKTCGCKGGKIKPTKEKKTTTETTPTKTERSTKKEAKETKETSAPTQPIKGGRGCCSGHGGIGKCVKGKAQCVDGASSSCSC